MKRRLISVILFAMLAALVSSTLLYNIISGSAPKVTKAKTAVVLVASRDLDAGSLVGDGDVGTVDWPVVEGTPWMSQKSDVVGRALLMPLAKGEPFAPNRLAAKGSAGGVASQIPPGMRVVPVHVDESTGLSRFIFPGMHVDVISTGPAPGQGIVARTILQNIEVFSTGQGGVIKDVAGAAPLFNLLVTPRQAEVMSQAIAQSKIQLVLRNPEDKADVIAQVTPPAPPAPKPRPRSAPKPVADTSTLEKSELLGANPAPKPPPTVEVIHGGKRVISPVSPAPPGSESH
jgi:pilus assembly protein CpaB